jgi:hypothetical protein
MATQITLFDVELSSDEAMEVALIMTQSPDRTRGHRSVLSPTLAY